MPIIIIAEHFNLTPAIRSAVEESAGLVKDLLPPSAALRVYLASKGKHQFSALYDVRAMGSEIVAIDSSRNLYSAIRKAANLMKRKILKIQSKFRTKRRHNRYAMEAL